MTAPGAKFCTACGTPLAAGARFCGECGAPVVVAETAAAPDGERRQVTVLFADLAGYTKLSSALDAEDLHALMSRVFAAIDGVIADFGGTVDKHIGDAVMALFGAPVAHHDDPERAVRAALAIHQAMARLSASGGRDLSVHVGIASGEVVAGSLGGDAAYTVLGDSVNLASRLDGLAGPGETLISDAVHRAVASVVRCAALGEVAVKGLDHAVAAWRVEGLEETARATRAAFVGRDAERQRFADIVASCLTGNAGQTLLLRGEAGIGKSHLVEQFETLAGDRGFARYKVLVLDFGVGTGQGAISTLARALAGLGRDAGPVVCERAIDKLVEGGVLDADRRFFLNDLIALAQPDVLRATYEAMDNATRSAGKSGVMADLLRGLGAVGPVMVTVEDVHLADPSTLGILAAMAAATADCQALLVMTSRLDGDPIDADWRRAAHDAALETIDLGPLGAADALAMAGGYIDRGGNLVRACIERAEGNPLFLEQLLRNAEEQGGEDMPASIQSLMLARMDRLAAADKRALQCAAVIGQRFALAPLRSLIDDPDFDCSSLVDHHLLRREADGFLFAHALIRDGAYGSLLKARVRDLHRRCADGFAADDPVLRAEHLDRADDDRAASAYLVAATGRAADYHVEHALRLARRGAELADGSSEAFALAAFEGELLHDLGEARQSIDAYRAALALAADDAQRCRAWFGVAAGMRVIDEFDDAFAALDRAEAVATGLSLDLTRIHHLRGNLYFPGGDIDNCRAQHELALRFAGEAGSPEAEALALGGLCDAEYTRGRMVTANDYSRRSVALAREHGFGRIEAANLPMAAHTSMYFNELREAAAEVLEAVRVARRIGHRRAEMVAHLIAAMAQFELGEFDATQASTDALRALGRSLGSKRFDAIGLALSARAAVLTGDPVAARSRIDEAVAAIRETGIASFGPRVLGALAVISEDETERREALAEGERVLLAGAIAQNHFWFRRDAIDVSLALGDWRAAERHADALEDYTAAEPLSWCRFVVARGRALAVHGRGERDPATLAKIADLHGEAMRIGLRIALPALEAALADGVAETSK